MIINKLKIKSSNQLGYNILAPPLGCEVPGHLIRQDIGALANVSFIDFRCKTPDGSVYRGFDLFHPP